jgi:HK97 gp10 family phage protein
MPSVGVDGANVSLEVQGAKELARTLKKAGADMQDLKASNRKAADVVVPAAKTNAPVGETGKLAASIRSGANQRMGIVRAGKKAVPYAAVQEFGWPKHHIRPHHFVVDAAHSTEPLWVQIYEDAVKKAINQVFGA